MKTLYSQIKSNQMLFGVLCVLLATLGLSFKAIFIKLLYLQNPQIDAVSILALRFLVAMPFFYLIFYYVVKNERKNNPESKQRYSINRHTVFGFILLGTFGFYVSAILDFSALAYIPAILERLVLFLYPTFVVLISLFLRPSEITRRIIYALFISYIGVIIVFFDHAVYMAPSMIKGVLLVLAAAIVFAIYTVASVKYIKQFGSVRFTVYAMMAATFTTLPHVVAVHGFDFLSQSLSVYGIILLMALFSTVMPLILMAEGIRRTSASSASIVSMVGPLITVTLAYFLLDEMFGLMQAIGGLMIIFGVFFVANKK